MGKHIFYKILDILLKAGDLLTICQSNVLKLENSWSCWNLQIFIGISDSDFSYACAHTTHTQPHLHNFVAKLDCDFQNGKQTIFEVNSSSNPHSHTRFLWDSICANLGSTCKVVRLSLNFWSSRFSFLNSRTREPGLALFFLQYYQLGTVWGVVVYFQENI